MVNIKPRKFVAKPNPTNTTIQHAHNSIGKGLWGRDFLAVLRPSAAWWDRFQGRHALLFRGHADTSWALLPSLWRSPAAPMLHRFLAGAREKIRIAVDRVKRRHSACGMSPSAFDGIALVVAEQMMAMAFGEMADQLGFDMPPCDVLSDGFVTQSPEEDFICKVLLEMGVDHIASPALLAVAQHHGMPTRLLDYSTHGLYAAYFATDPLQNSESRDVVVWVIAEHVVRKGRRLRIMRPRRTTSAYMLAQEGLFVYDERAWCHAIYGDRVWDHESIMNMFFSNLTDSYRLKCRVLLSRSHAAEVRELLWRERIHAASVQPSLDNVARTMGEMRWRMGEADS